MPSEPFTVDDLLNLETFTFRVPFHLSPDGRLLAVTVQRVRREAAAAETRFTPEGVSIEVMGSRIVLVDTETGAPRQPFSGTSWASRWSPDGRLLAAYVQHEGNACVGVFKIGTQEVRLLRGAEVRPFFGFEIPRWMPDSRQVVVKLKPSAIPEDRTTLSSEPAGQPWTVFSFDPKAFSAAGVVADTDRAFHYCVGDLAVVDVESGEVRRLAEDWTFRGWKVSPDGRYVALQRLVNSASDRQQNYYDFMLVPTNGDEPRRLVSGVPEDYGVCFNWAPDSRRIAHLSLDQGQQRRLFVLDVDSSAKPVELTSGDKLGIHDDEWDWAPRWSEDGRTVYCRWGGLHMFAADGSGRRHLRPECGQILNRWVQSPGDSILRVPDGRTVFFTTYQAVTKQNGLARLDLETGEGESLSSTDGAWRGEHHHMECSPDGGALFLTRHTAERPPTIWRLSSDGRNDKELFGLGMNFAAKHLGKARLISYRALRPVGNAGTQRYAAVMLPDDFQEGSPVPLIVSFYPGSALSGSIHYFGFSDTDFTNAHLFASRGYAVVAPDVLLDHGSPLPQLAGEVVPAVNYLIEAGIADPERIGVIGHSFGGWGVLGLLTQTSVFKAALASAGIVNLLNYGTAAADGTVDTSWFESGQTACGGTPWEKREAYLENSPFFYLDRVTTPLLVVAGTADDREGMQARQTYGALKRLGKQVELRLYHTAKITGPDSGRKRPSATCANGC